VVPKIGEILMRKVMLFIDGSWLSRSLFDLSNKSTEPWRVDYTILPQLLVDEVGKQIGTQDLDLVRVHYCSSYATNVDPRDAELSGKQLHFQNLLRDQFGFELDLYAIDFHGKRQRAKDRDPKDTFQPREKCVDIAVAASMLYYTAIPNAMDIAILVTGDRDFQPVMKATRLLGKRVALASVRSSCSSCFQDPEERASFLDYPVIWIEDHLEALRLHGSGKHLSTSPTFTTPMSASPTAKSTVKPPTGTRPPLSQKDEKVLASLDSPISSQPATLEKIDPLQGAAEAHLGGSDFAADLLRQDQFGSFAGFEAMEDGQAKGRVISAGLGVFEFTEADLYRGVHWNQLRAGIRLRFRPGRLPTASDYGLAWEVRPAVRI
jgi:hypothetical protein